MATDKKQETITFKVDAALAEALRQVPNKSEFIRWALLAALENQCPLCTGTGILTGEQLRHWERFREHHAVATCGECKAVHLVCESHDGPAAH